MKYIVKGKFVEYMKGEEIEADSEEEAKDIYQQLYDDGEIQSDECDFEMESKKSI